MIISTAFPPEEGIGNYVYGLSQQLIRKGHQVTIFTRGSFPKVKKEKIDGISVVKAPFFPLYPLYVHLHEVMLNSVFQKMEDEFDLVHIHSPLCPMVKTRLPIVATIHTPMMIDTQMRYDEAGDVHSKIEHLMGRTISYHFEQKLIERAEKITTVSYSVRDELESYGLDKQSIDVIGNGVDEQVFLPSGARSDTPLILYTGRIDYRKGLYDLIESSRYICEMHPDAQFIITGKGHLLEKLQTRVKVLGLSDHFDFAGFVSKSDLIRLYQQATIYVLPSHYEGLPTVLLEAMACGAPVVATAVSGTLDVIEDGVNGLLVPSKQPMKIADAVHGILADRSLQHQLSENARKTIQQKFTWDIISDSYLRIYEGLQ